MVQKRSGAAVSEFAELSVFPWSMKLLLSVGCNWYNFVLKPHIFKKVNLRSLKLYMKSRPLGPGTYFVDEWEVLVQQAQAS